MNVLLNKILTNKSNKKLLDFLNVDLKKKALSFKQWVGGRNGPDEGGCVLFDDYGIEVPSDCKYGLEIHNIMVNPMTGQIFAFHTGRFSIFFRCDFERSNLINSDDYRKGYTFDCISDITDLGEDWTFYKADFEDDVEQQFRRAYEKALTNC